MTFTRRDAWTLSQNQTWPDQLVWYARAVRAMQAKPITDPTSWQYQAAIHGLANTAPPPGAPWNECQHATWYFLPWHRMYLFQFENIVRAAVVAAGGPQDWALPYWNYEGGGQANQIPPAFRQATLPDGTANPLLVAARRAGINTGLGLPPNVTSSQAAMNGTVYTTPTGGVPVGFGGPRTGFAHFGPAPGLLENQPHNIVHVAVGGNGLMSNPDTAAQDPIFWLHHANIDRIWESWRIKTNANATTSTWLRRNFTLRDQLGKTVKMAVRSVLTTQDLGYTYDNLPADRGRRRGEDTVPPRTRPKTVGQSQKAMRVGRAGASTVVRIGELPRDRSTSGNRQARRFYLKLDDIEGRANPGVVYGVYVNLPDGADEATRDAHRVGTVSFFGIEHSTQRGSDNPQTLSYAFDATEVVEREQSGRQGGQVRVALVPEAGLDEGAAPDAEPAAPAATATTPRVTIGSVAIVTA